MKQAVWRIPYLFYSSNGLISFWIRNKRQFWELTPFRFADRNIESLLDMNSFIWVSISLDDNFTWKSCHFSEDLKTSASFKFWEKIHNCIVKINFVFFTKYFFMILDNFILAGIASKGDDFCFAKVALFHFELFDLRHS